MTLASFSAWFIFAVLMGIAGARFSAGPLLLASRAIDHIRAALACAELCWSAARQEWERQWTECLHWARKDR